MNAVRLREVAGLRLLLMLSLIATLSACNRSGTDAKAATDAPKKEQPAESVSGSSAETAKKAEKTKNKAVLVETAEVRRRAVAAQYSGTAALEAPDEAQVVAKTSGVLLKLMVEEGQHVRAGQVMALLDAERAQLEVSRAEATLQKLEAELKRSQELFTRKLVAADGHDRMRYDVATQKAAYDLARLELSYTRVVAPIDGVVALRMVKKGNVIALNQPMFRVVNNERLEAVLNVPEREVSKLDTGMVAVLRVDALPGEQFAGKIDRISPVVDGASGTFRTIALFNEGIQRLKPGMFGRLTIVYDRRADSLTVPRSALVDEDSEPAVFVVREQKVVRTPVELGHANGEYVEIRAGLSEGDDVVTAGKVAVRDGSLVEIVNPVPAGAADAGDPAARAPQG